MNRKQYAYARALLRANGLYALQWLSEGVRDTMDSLVQIQRSKDWLAERVDIVNYCKREGIYCTPRHTAIPERYRK